MDQYQATINSCDHIAQWYIRIVLCPAQTDLIAPTTKMASKSCNRCATVLIYTSPTIWTDPFIFGGAITPHMKMTISIHIPYKVITIKQTKAF